MPAANRLYPSSVAKAGPQPAAHDRENSTGDVLAELRKDLAVIVGDLKSVVERRTAEAGQIGIAATNAVAKEARQVIRSHPIASIGIAVLFGVGIATLIVPSRRTSRYPHGMPAWSLPQMPAALIQTARDFPASVSRSNTFSSLASALERVVEQASTLDPKAQLSPALEKAGTWLNGLRTSLGGK